MLREHSAYEALYKHVQAKVCANDAHFTDWMLSYSWPHRSSATGFLSWSVGIMCAARACLTKTPLHEPNGESTIS